MLTGEQINKLNYAHSRIKSAQYQIQDALADGDIDSNFVESIVDDLENAIDNIKTVFGEVK